jgi:hypothetical protein
MGDGSQKCPDAAKAMNIPGVLSGIIKGKATSCCFAGSPRLVAKNLCNVARGWVGCYATTIKMRREPVGTSLRMPVTLRLGRGYTRLVTC